MKMKRVFLLGVFLAAVQGGLSSAQAGQDCLKAAEALKAEVETILSHGPTNSQEGVTLPPSGGAVSWDCGVAGFGQPFQFVEVSRRPAFKTSILIVGANPGFSGVLYAFDPNPTRGDLTHAKPRAAFCADGRVFYLNVRGVFLQCR